MLAARLAELGQASVVIDRTGRFGLGVAYSTPFEGHLLNVRSNRMSAVDGRPDDFVQWLEAHRPDLADPEDFAPRAAVKPPSSSCHADIVGIAPALLVLAASLAASWPAPRQEDPNER